MSCQALRPLCLLLALGLAASISGAEVVRRRPEVPAPSNSGASAIFNGAVVGSILEIDRMCHWFTLRIIKTDGENQPPAGSVLSITCKKGEQGQMTWVRDLELRQQVAISVVPGENKSLVLTQYPAPPAAAKAAAPKEKKAQQ